MNIGQDHHVCNDDVNKTKSGKDGVQLGGGQDGGIETNDDRIATP